MARSRFLGALTGALASPGIGAALGVGSAAANLIPTPTDIANRRRLRELELARQRGEQGLSPEQRRALEQPQLQAIAAQTTGTSEDLARLRAAGGDRGAGVLEGIERGTQTALSEGARRVAEGTARADIAATQQQQAEEAALRAARSQRQRDVVGGVLSPLADAASLAGAAAGEVPEFATVSGLGGTPVEDFAGFESSLVERGLTPQDAAFLRQLEEENPGRISDILFQSLVSDEGDPRVRDLLIRAAQNRTTP